MPTACPEASGATLLRISVQDPRWSLIAFENAAEHACREALSASGMAWREFEIDVLACADSRMAALNEEFRGHCRPTNVLSWPVDSSIPEFPGMAAPLGNIAIAYDSCMRESREQGVDALAHATHLVLHGCMHLLGYGHENDAEAEIMERLERDILATLGLAIS
ncbi:MAG: rRNA maturation RNase YbeY [Albidovulum sp.]|nr:rRNA maturation RNase YbeY [Albidovulum sp.]